MHSWAPVCARRDNDVAANNPGVVFPIALLRQGVLSLRVLAVQRIRAVGKPA
jgi:hypothetical protein